MKKNTGFGFTLVELLIGMVLGLVILGGVLNLFTQNNQTYDFVQGQSRLQENARFALNELTRRARMIGYMGCFRFIELDGPNFVNTLNSGANDYYYQLDGGNLELHSVDVGLPAKLSTDLATTSPAGGTDVLVIRGIDDGEFGVAGAMPNTSADIKLNGNSGTSSGDVMLISDCQKAAIFQVSTANYQNGTNETNLTHNTGGSVSPGNATTPLSNTIPFDEDATVYNFSTNVFYVGPASFTNADGDTPNSLYQKTGTDAPFELVSGITSFQVWAGEDISGDGVADRFVRPNEITNLDNVVVLDLKITADSIENILHSDGTDRPIAREFTASVKLRNRGA